MGKKAALVNECTDCLTTFFGYETEKVIAVNSVKIGIIYRIIQVTILVYITGWVMYHERGYQAFDTAVSGVMVKVNGIMYTNTTDLDSYGQAIWDAADYAIPPIQNSGVFITTNVVITPNQTQGRCPEATSTVDAECFNDTKCPAGYSYAFGNGVYTGKCIQSVNRCEVYAWCPTEEDYRPTNDDSPFHNVVNVTLLVKNSIEFPRFKVKRRNILPWMTPEYLETCHFNANDPLDKYCPIFHLGELFEFTEIDVDNLLLNGGSVAISINWSCDLDYSDIYCLPKYTFSRLDDDERTDVGKGWNFRHAYTSWLDGKPYRTLVKAYGIQFFILVTGKGGQFDLVIFTMNCGSGLALLGAATLCCDILVLHLLKNRKRYREAKFDLLLHGRTLCTKSTGSSTQTTILTTSKIACKTDAARWAAVTAAVAFEGGGSSSSMESDGGGEERRRCNPQPEEEKSSESSGSVGVGSRAEEPFTVLPIPRTTTTHFGPVIVQEVTGGDLPLTTRRRTHF